MKMNNLIEARNLNKSYGSLKAVRDLNLHVSSGEIYGLIGPDGAGKRLRYACFVEGCVQTRIEKVIVPAKQTSLSPVTICTPARRGTLPNRLPGAALFTLRRPDRVGKYPLLCRAAWPAGAEWRPRCMEILDFVGLAQFIDRRAGQLSGGMKQKLGLAAALVHRPQVLLLDEADNRRRSGNQAGFLAVNHPVSWRESMGGQGQNVRQTAVLVSTPYMDEAARCSRIGFMVHGQLILEGAPGELRKRLQGRILELTGQPLVEAAQIARTEPGVQDVQMLATACTYVTAGQAEKVLAHLQESLPGHGIQGFRLRSIQPQLEMCLWICWRHSR